MQRDQLLAGRYRLDERLGRGGMSVVWRAHDEVLERDVAVKVLVATEPAARWRIQAEAKAAARLSHPNVTNVYDYGESPLAGEQVPFVVMELLSGTTLAQRLTEGPLPPKEALRIAAEVAAGLAAAHGEGLVHRDVKPENVMLTRTGAKVMDFGIAAVAGTPEIDVEGRLLGTPAYFAPERLDAGEVVAASDVYGLGLLLHRMLTGRLPWRRETGTGMLRAHAYEEPDPLPDIEGVPSEVGRLHRWCLAKDPVDRPTAAEAARVITTALTRTTADAPAAPPDGKAPALRSPASPPARPAPPVTARRFRFGSRTLVAVGAAVLGVVALAGTLGEPAFRRPGADEPDTGFGTGDTTSVVLPATADAPRAPAPSGRAASGGPSTPRSTTLAPASAPPGAGGTPSGSPTPGPTPTPSTARDTTDVAARGGTVSVQCVDKSAEIVSVTPATGYQIDTYEPGPAREVRVELVSTGNRSVITVRCANDRPKPRVKEQAD
ncbi:serine/threonine-protein kinase [Micromonospora sp. BQ11]|uniref:serine/threonine-protein kinase n=1 Tax=Micromonospora sp. BQ11 TaxID=3452212 RepID=UPI003F888643